MAAATPAAIIHIEPAGRRADAVNRDANLPPEHPPRPSLAFRVAVVGHRTERLPHPGGVRDSLAAVLSAVRKAALDAQFSGREAYEESPPVMRLVTALAEGSDRIAAKTALEQGYELQVILPFEREEYRRDFGSPGDEEARTSLEEFDRLLSDARTTAILELDGVLLLAHAATIGTADAARGGAELSHAQIHLEDATPPYEALAEVLVRQCDLLVAVWDGDRARGPGGTANIVRDARSRGLPTVVIDANDPGRLTFFADGAEGPFKEELLRETIFSMLEPPQGGGAHSLKTYLLERAPGWALGTRRIPLLGSRSLLNWVWPAFRTLASRSWPHHPTLSVGLPRPAGTVGEEGLEAGTGGSASPVLRPHYAWADGLATYYGNRYRSAFVVIYALGVVTVGLAALGLAASTLGHIGRFDLRLWLTLALLSVIVGIWLVGGFVKRWHRRWLDYRILAEYLRQMGQLAPLAGTSPRVRTPPHRSLVDPGNSWMAWQARALTREMGITSARFDGPYLEAARAGMRDAWVGAQAQYHRTTATRSARMEQMLHWAGLGLFALAFFTVAAAIYEESEPLTALEAILPALGSALAAIRGQAELERLARRSEGVAEWLDEVAAKLDLSSPHPGTSASRSLRATAETAAAAMLDEVLDWRIVLEVRPLELPA